VFPFTGLIATSIANAFFPAAAYCMYLGLSCALQKHKECIDIKRVYLHVLAVLLFFLFIIPLDSQFKHLRVLVIYMNLIFIYSLSLKLLIREIRNLNKGGKTILFGVIFTLIMCIALPVIYYTYYEQILVYISGVLLFHNTSLVLFFGGIFCLFLFERMEQYKKLSLIDSLTGLFNRRVLTKKIEELTGSLERTAEKLSVIMCDIDNFKNLNDSYGHKFGDEVIVAFSKILKSNCRKGDVVVRYGGEEFLVLLRHTDIKGALCLAERMKRDAENVAMRSGSNVINFTVSFGVSAYLDKRPIEECISDADSALYIAKEQGRNRVVANFC